MACAALLCAPLDFELKECENTNMCLIEKEKKSSLKLNFLFFPPSQLTMMTIFKSPFSPGFITY